MHRKAREERKPYTAEQIAICDKRIRRTCHPKQCAFVFDPCKRVACCVGRGGGKTLGMLLRIIRRMIRTSDANCLFIAATRQSAELLVWRELKRLMTDSLRMRAEFSEADLTCTLPNGAVLTLKGCDDRADIQKLRGITYHEVGIDEVASIKPELLHELLVEVLGPRAVGAICLIGTPGKELRGLFYDVTRPGSPEHRPYSDRDLPEYEGWNKWSSHHWTIEDGVDAGIVALVEINAAQLEEKNRNGWSDTNPIWLRERKAQWAADETTNVYIFLPHKDGAEWNIWSPKLDAFGLAVLPTTFKDWGYGIGVDVGFKDAFALEVFAFSFTDPSRTLWHVYEIYRTRLYAQAIAKLLIGDELNHDRYGGLIGHLRQWPVAMVGDFAGAGGALLTELQQVYGITVKAADKPYRYKENAIELLNSDFYDGRIRIMKDSKVAGELGALQWVVDAYGKRAENKAQANHGTDATLYLRNALAPLLPRAGSAPPPASSAPASKPVDDDVPRPPPREYGNADEMYTDEL